MLVSLLVMWARGLLGKKKTLIVTRYIFVSSFRCRCFFVFAWRPLTSDYYGVRTEKWLPF